MKRRAISLMLIILFMLQEVSAYAPAESERVVTSNTETARSFYTVRFLVEEGDAPAARFYDAQSAPTFGSLPAAPSVDGEVFTGWFLPDSDEPVDAGTVVPGDTTLVARYEPVAAREAGAGDAQADETETIPYSHSEAGSYAQLSVTGPYTNDRTPAVTRVAPEGNPGESVLDAWMVSGLEEGAPLVVSLTVTALPELAEDETLAVYGMTGGCFTSILAENVGAGDSVALPILLAGEDGIALVKRETFRENAEVSEESVISVSDALFLTGQMPEGAVAVAESVAADIGDAEVLAACDIAIYANEERRAAGEVWQPANSGVQIHLYSERFGEGELFVYRARDDSFELVGAVAARGGWVEFEAVGRAVYAVVRPTGKRLSAQTGSCRVTVTCDSAAGISEDTYLSVAELGDAYLDDMARTLGWTDEDVVFYTRFLDISLVGNGEPAEPAGTVKVTVELSGVEECAEALRVVHFTENGAEVVNSAESADGVISFETDSLSAFGFGSILRPLVNWKIERTERVRMTRQSVAGALRSTAADDTIDISLMGFTNMIQPAYAPVPVELEEGLEPLGAYAVAGNGLSGGLSKLWVQVAAGSGLATREREHVCVYALKGGVPSGVLADDVGTAAELLSLDGADGFVVALDSGYRRRRFTADGVTLEGMMPRNVEAQVTAADVDGFDEELLGAYSITITDSNGEYQPDPEHPVDVAIVLPGIADAETIRVWHISDDGDREEVSGFSVEGETVRFRSVGFSVYAVTGAHLKKTIEASDGNTYEICVTYDSASGIPEDAELEVTEVSDAEHREYLTGAAEILGADVHSITYGRLFDIAITKDGVEYQPNNQVTVTVSLLDAAAIGDVKVVHFPEETDALSRPEELGANTSGASVTFETDGFSVFSFLDFSLYDRIVEAVLSEEEGTLYENDDIALTGAMPPFGFVEADRVEAAIEGVNVLVAYDIRIYSSPLMKAWGINWQPEDGAIQVTIKSDALAGVNDNLSVYHMTDENAEAEFVTSLRAFDSTVTFPANSFSIYPIGEDEDNARIGYRFWYNDGSQSVLLSTQYFRYKDVHPTGSASPLTLSEPSIPGIESSTWNRIFKGWSETSYNDDAANLKTVSMLNDELLNLSSEEYIEGTFIDLYANLENVYYVTYVDVNPNNVLATIIVPIAETGDTTFDVYSEAELRPTITADTVLNGWYDLENGGALLPPGTQNVVITGNMKLYPNVQGGYWLVFDDNDLVDDGSGNQVSGGASFTPAVFYIDEPTVQPADPTWTGYAFGGWYTTEECLDGQEFVFGGILNHDTTVHAKWIPSASQYRVIVWKQRTSDAPDAADSEKTYAYIYSDLYTNVVTGETVTLADSYKRIYGTNGTSPDTDKRYYTYNAVNSDQSAVVKADGSSVLNVYYDREPVTLNFYVYDYTYTPTTGNGGTQYGYYNGAYVEIYYNNGTWYRTRTGNWFSGYTYSNPYSGPRYTRSNNKSWQIYKTFIGLYGSTLEDNGYAWPDEYYWYDTGSNSGGTSGTRTTFMSAFLPTGNVTTESFYAGTVSGSKHIHFLVQELNGDYTEKDVVATSGGSFYISDKYIGFHASQYRADNGDWRSAGDKNSSGYYNNGNSVSYSNNLYIRFDRNDYTLTFYTNNGANQLIAHTLKYGENLSSLANQGPGQKAGCYFLGWFADPSCTEPFDFSQTMPDTNMAVYGKWKKERFRVVIVPGAGNVYMGSQALTFRVDFDERIGGSLMETATRAGYILDGWYTDPAFTNRFLFSTAINSSLPDVDMTYQTSPLWAATRAAYGDDDEDHDNVRGILHLYAKWILDTDSTGINVIYDAGDAALYNSLGEMLTTVPIDTYMYTLDGMATTREAPSNYNDLYTFKYWEATKLDETTVHYNSGDPINLAELTYSDPVYDENGALLRKTVVLYAVYEQTGDSSRLTTITYDGNTFLDTLYDGSQVEMRGKSKDGTQRFTITMNKEVNETIELPDEEDFYLDGWSLVGWAFTEGTYEEQMSGYDVWFLPGQMVSADNLDIDETNNEDNILYAMWQPKTYTVTVRQVVESGVPVNNFAYDYRTGAEDQIESALETVAILTGNSSFTVTSLTGSSSVPLQYYERTGHVIQIATPVPTDDTYDVRVSAVVTRDDGTTEILNPTAAGNYEILGDVTITYTYSLRVLVRLQKRDVTNAGVLTDAVFVLTPVEFNQSTQHWENAGGGKTITIDTATKAIYVQAGTYLITEANAPEGYAAIGTDLYLTVEKDEPFLLFTGSGAEVSPAIAALDGTGTILTIYDRPIKFVSIKKTVEGENLESAGHVFEVTLSLDGFPLTHYDTVGNGLAADTTNNAGVIQFRLAPDETKALLIPWGAEMEIAEKNYPQYLTEVSSEAGIADEETLNDRVYRCTVVEDDTITFTNKNTLLTVTKEVVGGFADPEEAFTFTLDGLEAGLPYKLTVAETAVTVTAASDGTISFILKNGETMIIPLPGGSEYTVIETAKDGYTTTISVNGEAPEEAVGKTVTLTSPMTLAFTNYRPAVSPTGYRQVRTPVAWLLLAGCFLIVLSAGHKRKRGGGAA